MTKIDIISGFLGAGKTTLIKKLIAEGLSSERLVLIENEFGEIGIDGGFLKEAGVQISEMNSGCICCSLVGDFSKALDEVLEKYNPDRVIIEPSGVGKLSDVITAVQKIKHIDEVSLNNLVTVADATKTKMYMKNFKEFFNNQLESANTIILSRTQKLSEEKLEEVIKQIKELNPKATLVTTAWDDIKGTQILEAMEHKNAFAEEVMQEHIHSEECGCGHHHHHEEHEHGEECGCGHHHHHEEHDHGEECGCGHHHHHEEHEHGEECTCGHHHHHEEHEHEEGCTCGHHHHHHADEVFTSWGVETAHKYSEDELKNILDTLANTEEFGIILRAKGIVQSKDGSWINYDLVPGEYEIRKGNPDYTGKLCVIGTNLKEDELAKLFNI